MSNAVFPTSPGLEWQIGRTPVFHTLIQETANGQAVRVPLRLDPMWRYECSFEFLRDDLVYDELNRLLGFYLARQGAFDSFLLDLGSLTGNPLDSAVTGQLLNVDANNCAPLVRTLGASQYGEQIYELNGTPVIQLDGATLAAEADYRLYTPAETARGTLNANRIGYSGYAIKLLHAVSGTLTADFGFYYRVRFEQDQQEFNLFSYLLYEAQQVVMVTARE